MRYGISNEVVDSADVKNAKVELVVESDIHGRDENTVVRGGSSKRIKNINRVSAVGVNHETIKAECGRMLSEVVKH